MKAIASVFREYDVRGLIGSELTPELAYHLGRAIGTLMRERSLRGAMVGRDCRPSGVAFAEQTARGFAESGIDVADIGMVATPTQYFSMHHHKAGGGVQVTGSHNPPEFNGFKISLGGTTAHGADIQRIRELVESEAYATGQGSVRKSPIDDAYLSFLADNLRLGSRKLRVVVDSGNGMGGLIAPTLYRKLGCEVIELYSEPDGTFPHHHPDPTLPETLVDLRKKVLETSADLGIAFDGDADRIGVIDDKGEIIWGDKLMILLSRAVLKAAPGATILGEVKCSQTLYDDITKHGGNAVMWKTGHSLIKAKMLETGALLAGEMSGHIFFKHRYFGFDDATYAGGRLLEIISASDAPLSQMLAGVPTTFATPELRVDCPDDEKFKVVSRAQAHFAKTHAVSTVDGARIQFPDGWALIRASNTQPVLVTRFEAATASRLAEIRSFVESELRSLMG